MIKRKLVLYDRNKSKDNCSTSRTDIQIRCEETGELLFRGSNKVTVSGSAFTAGKHFNITPDVETPNYNTMLGLDNTVNEPFITPGIRREEQVYLFCVGTSGGGQEASQVYDVDYTKWIRPESLVPFKYQLITNDIPEYHRDKYFGRKTQGKRIIYYFKSFESPPVFKQQYADGTPIDENIYDSNRKDEVESFVEINLKITKQDCRDFFLATTGINDAHINTISLLTAYKTEKDGHVYYQKIKPLTQLNFCSEQLTDLSKGVDIIYHIYY